MHAVSRRRGRGRTRILYWFRTPPGVRVGRAPLDEDAIKLIEARHPDIRFDWPQILKGEEEAPPSLPAPRPVREPVREAVRREAPALPPPAPFDPDNPAHAQLGGEGLARLRARYADVVAAILRRVTDVDRQNQLKVEAARLNPDNWATADEVRIALEGYEAVFETLRSFLVASNRRRRRRKSRQSAPPASSSGAGPPVPGAAAEPNTPQSSEDFAETGEDSSSWGEPSQD